MVISKSYFSTFLFNMVFLRRMYKRTPFIAQAFRCHLLAGKLTMLRSLPWRGVRPMSSVENWLSAGSIFSLSSGHGKCGVAVIRVSGPKASIALKEIGRFVRLPGPRRVVLRKLWHPHTCQPIDRALVIWFPGENVLQYCLDSYDFFLLMENCSQFTFLTPLL